jgi:hypothetical protein
MVQRHAFQVPVRQIEDNQDVAADVARHASYGRRLVFRHAR